MKNILVTGGSGFLGRTLIQKLLIAYPYVKITSISRSEGHISELLTQCGNGRLRIAIGDIRNKDETNYFAKDADTIIHLAAMKRVDTCEDECMQGVNTNIIGTMNVINAFNGQTFILMSTDKVVEPISCYGATKLVAEKLVTEQARKQIKPARYMIIRSGNVKGSTGSVLEIWKKQIEQNNEITVTDPEMTRLFTSADHIAYLILSVLERGENGKIYIIPQGKGIRLGDLAEEVIRLYGNSKTKIKIIGKRPGEKLHEKTHLPHDPNIILGFDDMIEVSDTSTQYELEKVSAG